MTRHDPFKVLNRLADTLDVEETITSFPGLTREALSKILRTLAGGGEGKAAVLSVDGAARGNPGESGAGVFLEGSEGAVYRYGEYLGTATNNVAEYRALLAGMEKAAGLGYRVLRVRSDSELMVKQLNGLYKVKSPQLQELYFSAIKSLSSFEKVTFEHVPREENREADRMANLAIDAKGPVEL